MELFFVGFGLGLLIGAPLGGIIIGLLSVHEVAKWRR